MKRQRFLLSTTEIEKVKHHPFLVACLQDAKAAEELMLDSDANRRHIVCYMHDAIEFALYEILTSNDIDVYVNGQNTIGLNDAINEYRKLKKMDPPFIGVLRMIQKHRGDAKHHAQIPDEMSFNTMTADFPALIVRLILEEFAEEFHELGLLRSFMPYHQALWVEYRKRRNRNWEKATPLALRALLHSVRRLFSLPDDYKVIASLSNEQLVEKIEQDLTTLIQRGSIEEIPAKALQSTMDAARNALGNKDFRAAAEVAAAEHSIFYQRLPNFDRDKAIFLTSRLAKPDIIRITGPTSWTKWQSADTDELNNVRRDISSLLESHPGQILKLGEPYFDSDEDRYWRWWELAVFDGEEWQTFLLSDKLDVSLESTVLPGEEGIARRMRAANAIKAELIEAIGKDRESK